MRNRLIKMLSAYLVLLLCSVLGLYIWQKSREPNTQVVGFFDGIPGTRLIIGAQLADEENPPVVRDERILLPFETVRKYIDPYIWWDENQKKVIVTTKDRVIRMETGKLEALVNEEPIELQFPPVEENGTLYVPIDFLKDFYGINIRYVPENDVVIIDRKNSIYRMGEPLSADAVVRTGMSIKEPIVRRFSESELGTESARLVIFEEYESWYRVRTYDGILGYIPKADVVVNDIIMTGDGNEIPEDDPELPAGKITMVWDMTYSKKYMEFSRNTAPGIDVISPTWFEITDREGTLKNRANPDYMEWAHSNGWQVWAHVANDFDDIEGTSIILNSTELRYKVIKQILAYASLYDLDGINIDFENIYLKDSKAYTQFVREITPLLREQGLVVSVAVGVPGGSETWSLSHDRKALGETVDYVCLMTYDQNWPGIGSTAELEWVENRLAATLEEVPAEKILLGIPLYTRLWSEETVEGKVKTSYIAALTIDGAWQRVEENDAAVVWNPVQGQYSATYEKDGKTIRMWIEDADSVNAKSSLILKYNLAGACIWAANFANESVWPVLERNLKEITHYEEWKSLNVD
jgi:Copper amine oxidase N-terminal domain./Glycosyl hydrolases family 18.